MVIPAAGRGSRLASSLPKVLTPVNGRPMLDYLFESYNPYISHFVIVVHPSFQEEVERYCSGKPYTVEFATQKHPTGMLDAILLAQEKLKSYRPDCIWITWCDQIAVHPVTIKNLYEIASGPLRPDLLFPTVRLKNPYTHLVRNASGEITKILHRREGDLMPWEGESEMGVFCLSPNAYFNLLVTFSNEVQSGSSTKERNFLPFIPWVGNKGTLFSYPAQNHIEALGINTQKDLQKIEAHLRSRHEVKTKK